MARVAKKRKEPSANRAPSARKTTPNKKRKTSGPSKSSPHAKSQHYKRSQRGRKVKKIIRDRKTSLKGRSKRKKPMKIRIPKEPSETALVLLMMEQMDENDNKNDNMPQEGSVSTFSSHCVDDLGSC